MTAFVLVFFCMRYHVVPRSCVYVSSVQLEWEQLWSVYRHCGLLQLRACCSTAQCWSAARILYLVFYLWLTQVSLWRLKAGLSSENMPKTSILHKMYTSLRVLIVWAKGHKFLQTINSKYSSLKCNTAACSCTKKQNKTRENKQCEQKRFKGCRWD